MPRIVALALCALVVSGEAAADPVAPDAETLVLERQATKQRRFRAAVGVGSLVLGAGTLALGYYGATHSNDGIAEVDRLFRYISYGNLVAGSVLSIAGTVLLIRKSPQERLRDKRQLAPVVAPARRGGLLGFAARF